MKPFLSLKSVDDVLAIINAFPQLASENVSLNDSCGRRLAAPFFAPADLPGFDRSTVDGYAARARDIFGASENSPALLACIGECHMGCQPDLSIGPGQTAAILTGGMMPEGADCAVMIENTRPAVGNLVEVIRACAPGDNVVLRDDDASAGAQIIASGKKLRPQEIGMLAAFGITSVNVFKRARVIIISSGDEIIPIDQILRPGQMRDVNAHSLTALCLTAGAYPVFYGIIGDEPGDLAAALRATLSEADIIVVSGGSSAGMRDHTVEAFTSLPDARLLAHGVAISPGKPFILANSGAKILMGLPGHVSSALICAHVFLLPLISRLQGRMHAEPEATIPARLTRSVASAQGRRDYIRVRLERDENSSLATPLTAPSAVIAGLVSADGLVICPENSEGVAAGQEVNVHLF